MHPELWEVVLLDEMERDEARGAPSGDPGGCLGCGCLIVVVLVILALVGRCAGGG
jgi:hypothetical protein